MRRSKKALSMLVLVVFLVSVLCITAFAEEPAGSNSDPQNTAGVIVNNDQNVNAQSGPKNNTATTSSGGGKQANNSGAGTGDTGTGTEGSGSTGTEGSGGTGSEGTGGTDDSDSQSNASGNDHVASVDAPVDSAVLVDHASTVAVGVQANRTIIVNRSVAGVSVRRSSSASSTPTNDIPKTGDTMDSVLWIVIGGIGVALIAYVVVSNLKRKNGAATK